MRRLLLFFISLNVLVCGGCAVFNRNNTPALNFVERNIIPKENPGRALFYPLAIPIGATAVSLDMFLIHPATVVGDAWDDTVSMLWEKHLDWEGHYMTTSASLLPRAVATPLVAGGAFLGRSAFDISPRRKTSAASQADDKAARQAVEAKRKEQQEKVAQARRSLEAGDPDTALRLANEVLAQDGNHNEATVIKATVLLEHRDLVAVAALSRSRLFFGDARFAENFVKLLTNGTGVERMQLLVMLDGSGSSLPLYGKGTPSLPLLMAALEKDLADSDRAIQLKTMQLLGRYQYGNSQARLLLEGVAKGSDPVLAVAAKGLLR